jgi:copper(I)-binding protein
MQVGRFRGWRVSVAGFIQVLGLFSLVACGSQKHREAGLLFKDWYVVKPLAAGSGSVAYGTITNESTAPQTLKKADFSCAAAAELHETITDGNRARMVPLPSLTLAAGETAVFEPGHKHAMLEKLTLPADEKCGATFTFETTSVRFSIPIRERKK